MNPAGFWPLGVSSAQQQHVPERNRNAYPGEGTSARYSGGGTGNQIPMQQLPYQIYYNNSWVTNQRAYQEAPYQWQLLNHGYPYYFQNQVWTVPAQFPIAAGLATPSVRTATAPTPIPAQQEEIMRADAEEMPGGGEDQPTSRVILELPLDLPSPISLNPADHPIEEQYLRNLVNKFAGSGAQPQNKTKDVKKGIPENAEFSGVLTMPCLESDLDVFRNMPGIEIRLNKNQIARETIFWLWKNELRLKRTELRDKPVELLFQIFYHGIGHIVKRLAAHAIFFRGWKFHKGRHVWMKLLPLTGVYRYFDYNKWEFATEENEIEESMLLTEEQVEVQQMLLS